MKRILFISFVLAVLGHTTDAGAQTPHRSFDELLSSNGWGSVHIYLPEHKIAAFYPHIYRQWSPERPITPNLAYDAYFGVRGPATWLPESTIISTGYEPSAAIMYMVRQVTVGTSDATVITRVFAPFDLDAPGFVMMLEVQGPVDPMAVFALLNFRVGAGDDHSSQETVIPHENGYLEYGERGYFMYYRPVTVPDGVQVAGAGPSSPYNTMKNGNDFGSLQGGFTGEDVAVGLQFNVPGGVPASQKKYFAVVVAGGESERQDDIVQKVEQYVGAITDPADLLEDERTQWQQFQARARLPLELSSDEEALARMGLVVMRMAQVREDTSPSEDEPCGGPQGQILAAMPKARPDAGEGIWNIAWVRDGAYAIVALARTGYLDEAKQALEFMMRARAGEYSQAVGGDYGVSVCRYYGCGREESDWDQNGPNIEFDDFGLFLWAFAQVGMLDPAWASAHMDFAGPLVANVLASLVEKSTFLVAPDSSIWERHWNGNEKHFTYTDAMAVKGLCSMASLADMLGQEDGSQEYWRSAVSLILKGIRTSLVNSQNVLVGNAEEPDGENLDMAAVEVFNFGLIPPDDPVIQATLSAWDQHFYDGDSTYGGYFRNDDGDWYDEQEWTFIDLRTSVALRLAGDTEAAEALIGWVTAQSVENFGLMGELYCRGSVNCPQRGDYKGSVPMVGFGPGAYLLSLYARTDDAPSVCANATDTMPGIELPPESDGTNMDYTDSTASDTGSGKEGSGCSCRTVTSGAGSSQSGLYLLIFVAFMALFMKKYGSNRLS